MNRTERDRIIKDTRVAFDDAVKMIVHEFVENGGSDDSESAELLVRSVRLMYRYLDYVDFQCRQFDHIEDRIDELHDMVFDMSQKKEAIKDC